VSRRTRGSNDDMRLHLLNVDTSLKFSAFLACSTLSVKRKDAKKRRAGEQRGKKGIASNRRQVFAGLCELLLFVVASSSLGCYSLLLYFNLLSSHLALN